MGEYAEKFAQQIDRFSTTLRERSVEDLMYEAENFARREPQLFLGGAVVLGLLAARFFKSSASRGRQQGYGYYGQGRYYGSTYSGYGYGGQGQGFSGQGYSGQDYSGQGYTGQRYSGSSSGVRTYSTDMDEPGTSGTEPPTGTNPSGY
jgi:hypothetical protein